MSQKIHLTWNWSIFAKVTIRSQLYFFRHIVHYNIMTVTIVTVSLSAPPTVAHIQRWADISHIMSQTMLDISRLGNSCWQLVACYVWGAAVRHLRSILFNIWAVLTARVSQEYNIMHERTSHTCIAHRHRPHSQQQYTNTHRPTRHPPLDKQCRSATVISTWMDSCFFMVSLIDL